MKITLIQRTLAAMIFLPALASVGCNQLLKEAGAPIVTEADIRINNASNMKVCKVTAKKAADDSVVEENALAGGAIGIDPGEKGSAQVDDRVGKIKLDIYVCDEFGKESLIQTAQADTASPSEILVH